MGSGGSNVICDNRQVIIRRCGYFPLAATLEEPLASEDFRGYFRGARVRPQTVSNEYHFLAAIQCLRHRLAFAHRPIRIATLLRRRVFK